MDKNILTKFIGKENIRWVTPTIKDFKSFISSINPMQLIFHNCNINLMIFKVSYKYTTVRGNKKDGTKFFVVNTCNPEFNTKNLFYSWIDEFNKNNNNRSLSNVKFLDSESQVLLII